MKNKHILTYEELERLESVAAEVYRSSYVALEICNENIEEYPILDEVIHLIKATNRTAGKLLEIMFELEK